MAITSEEFTRKALNEMFKPKVPEEVAVDLVSKIYGLEVIKIKNMHSFHDQNFHIKVSKNHKNSSIKQVSDDGYTLKIMNTLKSSLDEHFDAMHKAMGHLLKKGLRVPEIIRTLDDQTWHLETLPLLKRGDTPAEFGKCGIHLLTYIPGSTVASIPCTPENFFEWGSMLATVHTCLEDLDCPALKLQPTFLDVKYFSFIKMAIEKTMEGELYDEETKSIMRNILKIIPYEIEEHIHSLPQEKTMEGELYDEETKSIMRNILKRIPYEIEEHIHSLPQGFLHADFNDYNVLVQRKASDSENATYTIDGILDFDEMHFGAYVWDLGNMLGHVLVTEKTIDPLEAAGLVIAGYRSSRQLSELELCLLKTCIEGRLLMMALIPTAADDDPNNTYVAMLAPLKPKIDVLKLLDATSTEDLLDIWNGILKKYPLNKKVINE